MVKKRKKASPKKNSHWSTSTVRVYG